MPSFLRHLPRGPRALAVIFAGSGVLHLVVPRVYAAIVPGWVPRPRAVVAVSGAVELVCAAGLATESPWAGAASAATLLAVWPANVQMALDANSPARRVVLWLRVPLQLPMLAWALQARPSRQSS